MISKPIKNNVLKVQNIRDPRARDPEVYKYIDLSCISEDTMCLVIEAVAQYELYTLVIQIANRYFMSDVYPAAVLSELYRDLPTNSDRADGHLNSILALI